MTRYGTFAAMLAATALLAGCGGSGNGTNEEDTGQPTMQTPDLPNRDTIYRTSTVADLEALGARKLTEVDFMSEIVGKRLRNTGGVNSGATTDGWLWKFSADGTVHARSAKGRLESDGGWESNLDWWFANGQQCQRGSDGDISCRTVYELNGVYRWADPDDPDNLTGWSVEEAAWDAGALLHDGEILTGRNVAAMRRDQLEGTSKVIDPVGFSIRRTESGEYVVVLDGFKHTFTKDQLDAAGGDAEGVNDALDIKFTNWTSRHEEIEAGHSKGEYFIVFAANRDHEEIHGPDPQLYTFAVVGNPTTDFSRMNDVTATYQGGFALLNLYTKSFDNFDWDSDDRVRLRSREGITLTANFADSTISGNIAGFRDEDANVTYDGILTIPATPFTADGFSGDFGFSTNDPDNAVTASYDASFWGPDANHVVGTISVHDATAEATEPNGKSYAGVGWFGVGKQE